ncbi:hypothetical protein CMV_004624 [Castanea mollissima]|uniref:Uncharacterized protein n=1 Tax=Castanea mollissima TaxID=60419 RepID=A0A8J4RRJ5_9ROSI|nr:hypothetical protein CMV_004624 [Castanea mollissima]
MVRIVEAPPKWVDFRYERLPIFCYWYGKARLTTKVAKYWRHVIEGDRTFGAIIHPKIQIVAQFTWNNKFHLSYKLVGLLAPLVLCLVLHLPALEKALPEELVKSLKEQGSLKKGSIRVDMEELDLEEIDEGLKQKISSVLNPREDGDKCLLVLDIPNLSSNNRRQNCKLSWNNWWNVMSSCGSGFCT